MSLKKLTPLATRPGYMVVESIASADGGQCLAINGRRVAGGKPAVRANNILYRWNVSASLFQEAISAARLDLAEAEARGVEEGREKAFAFASGKLQLILELEECRSPMRDLIKVYDELLQTLADDARQRLAETEKKNG